MVSSFSDVIVLQGDVLTQRNSNLTGKRKYMIMMCTKNLSRNKTFLDVFFKIIVTPNRVKIETCNC